MERGVEYVEFDAFANETTLNDYIKDWSWYGMPHKFSSHDEERSTI